MVKGYVLTLKTRKTMLNDHNCKGTHGQRVCADIKNNKKHVEWTQL